MPAVLTSLAPITIPITLTVNEDTLRAVLPLLHSGPDTTLSTLALTFSLDPESVSQMKIDWIAIPPPEDKIRIQIGMAVEAGRAAGMDLVGAIQRIERALYHSQTAS